MHCKWNDAGKKYSCNKNSQFDYNQAHNITNTSSSTHCSDFHVVTKHIDTQRFSHKYSFQLQNGQNIL